MRWHDVRPFNPSPTPLADAASRNYSNRSRSVRRIPGTSDIAKDRLPSERLGRSDLAACAYRTSIRSTNRTIDHVVRNSISRIKTCSARRLPIERSPVSSRPVNSRTPNACPYPIPFPHERQKAAAPSTPQREAACWLIARVTSSYASSRCVGRDAAAAAVVAAGVDSTES